jgi:vitamin B12 transport system ATP-binding protein
MMNQNRDLLSLNCLSLHNVSAGSRLLPFSAQVNRGALIHIIGPNGAGKSTLLSSWPAIAPIYISNNSQVQ